MTSTTGFYAFSATHPDRPAVVTPDGEMLTFGALASRVNRISHGLRSLGLAHGDVVASAAVTGRVFTAGGGTIGVVEAWRLGPEVRKEGLWSTAELGAIVPGLVEKAAPNVDMFGRAPGQEH